MGILPFNHWLPCYPLVNVYIANWINTMLFMAKSTISTGPFSIANSQFTNIPFHLPYGITYSHFHGILMEYKVVPPQL